MRRFFASGELVKVTVSRKTDKFKYHPRQAGLDLHTGSWEVTMVQLCFEETSITWSHSQWAREASCQAEQRTEESKKESCQSQMRPAARAYWGQLPSLTRPAVRSWRAPEWDEQKEILRRMPGRSSAKVHKKRPKEASCLSSCEEDQGGRLLRFKRRRPQRPGSRVSKKRAKEANCRSSWDECQRSAVRTQQKRGRDSWEEGQGGQLVFSKFDFVFDLLQFHDKLALSPERPIIWIRKQNVLSHSTASGEYLNSTWLFHLIFCIKMRRIAIVHDLMFCGGEGVVGDQINPVRHYPTLFPYRQKQNAFYN